MRSLSLFVFLLATSFAQAQNSQTFTAPIERFTVPAGVTSITVQCWGRGGASLWSGKRNIPTGAGGGGAYAASTFTVKPGNEFKMLIGADAEFSSGAMHVLAKQGADVAEGVLIGGQGGKAADCVGTTKFSGGNGGNTVITAVGFFGGGGGGGAGPNGNGANGGNGSMGNAGLGGIGFRMGGIGGYNWAGKGSHWSYGAATPAGGAGGGDGSNGGDSGKTAPGRAMIVISW